MRDSFALLLMGLVSFGQSMPLTKSVIATAVLAVGAEALAQLYTSARLRSMHPAVGYEIEQRGPQAVFICAANHYLPARLGLQGSGVLIYGALNLG